MSKWQLAAAAGAIVVLFVLILGLERHRNCRYGDGVHCETFGIGLGKYGGPSR